MDTPGSVIAAFRRARSWSAAELGRRVDVDRSTVGRVESGALPIRAADVTRWLDALEATAAERELMGRVVAGLQASDSEICQS